MRYISVGLLLLGMLIPANANNCSAMHYGPSCQKCNCTIDGSDSCDATTGECQCKSGFTGPICIDIDECEGSDANLHCTEKYTYCRNLPGSFQCECKTGFKRTASGKCYPCVERGKGVNCTGSCKCEDDNTVSCLTETGTCICKRGWEGPSCSRSVNDCAKKPCKNLKCVDTHQGHVCVCEHGQRYVRGHCRDFSVQLHVLEQNPVYGQLMNVYILYRLSHPYVVNPRANPDFVYKIYINDQFVCKISFHATHVRIRGREYVLKMLNSDKYHHFYSHFQFRRSDPSLVVIKAVPESREYYEITRTLGESNSPDIVSCLADLKITGTSPCNQHGFGCLHGNVPVKLRQKYHKFKMHLNPSTTCQHNYQFTWTYATLSDKPQRDTCLITFQNFDISELIYRSGEPSITDHHGELEVVPKNTLPQGLIMICVDVYLKYNEIRIALSCGVIKVTPSVTLVGHVKPYGGRHYCTAKKWYEVEADFRVPDTNQAVKYDWLYIYASNYGQAKKAANRRYAQRSSSKKYSFYCEPRYGKIMLVELTVSAGGKKKHFEKIFTYKQQTFKFRCLMSCGHTVGSEQTVVLIFDPDKVRPGNWDLSGMPTTYMQKVPGEYIVFKPAAKNQDGTYTLQYKNGHNKVTYYEIKVPEYPIGGGCSINPNSGRAIFTEFTVNCRGFKWKGSSDSLRFHLYREELLVGGSKKFLNMIAYGGSPVMSGITLSSNKKNGDETVKLTLKILSLQNSHYEHHFSVKVQVDDQKDTLAQVIDNITEPYLKQNRQENVRFVNDVANVIFPKGTASMTQRVQARNELLKVLGSYKGKSAEWVMHVAAALEKVTGREDEMEHHGVTAGIKVLSQLCENLYKVGQNDILTKMRVTSVLIPSAARLIYKVSTLGTDIVRATANNQRKVLLLQNKEDSKRAFESIIKITDAMFHSLLGRNEKQIKTLKHIEIGVDTRYIDKNGKFNFGTQEIRFYLPAPSLGIGGSIEFVDGAYHVYEKNPYSHASEYMHGDLPLIYVDFARRGSVARDFKVARSKAVKASKLFRFIRPADVILKFQSPAAETKTHTIAIDVEVRKDKKHLVAKSSCLFISVPISPRDTTALMIRSQDHLPIKVIMSYTNDVKKLNDTGHGEYVLLPLAEIPSTKVAGRTLSRDPYTIFLPPRTKADRNLDILYYRLSISLQTGVVVDPNKLHIAHNQGGIRGSDSAQDSISAYLTNITVAPFRMSCKHYDTVKNAFTSKKCFMTEFSNLNYLHCRCFVAGAYTGSVQSLSSLIYPLNLGIFFEPLYSNPVAPTLLVATWMVIIALSRWAKLHDRRDEESCKVTILADNSDQHTYLYLIGVLTGKSAGAGTSSNVYIYLKGSWGRSSIHHLYDSGKILFQKAANNWFILTTSDDIGDIRSVVMWTDFSGAYPSWFLKSIIVENLHTNESWIFQYNSWLSIAKGFGKLVAEIPAYKEWAGRTTLAARLHNMMKSDIVKDLLWLGLFLKSPTDKFTRVRRLATGLTMLQALMLVNLMIFRISRIDVTREKRQHVMFLEQKIHLSSIRISLESASVMTLVGMFFGFIFRRTKDKPAPKHRTQFTLKQQDMAMRQDDMVSRKRQGLEMYYPLLTHYKYELPMDMELDSDLGTVSEEGTEFSEAGTNEETEKKPENQEEEKKQKTHEEQTKQENKEEVKSSLMESQDPPKTVTEVKKREFEKLKQEMIARGKPSSRTFMLMWWSIYLTWIMVLILNGMLAYYIVIHGLRLKYEESFEWLLSFLMGVIFNAVLYVPIIVILKAAVKVLILRMQQSDREEGPISHLAQGMKLLLKYRIGRTTYDSYKQKRATTHPPNILPGEAKKVLERLRVESEAREMIRDLILYTIFMAAILIIINGHLNVSLEHQQMISVENEILGLNTAYSLGEEDDGEDVLAEIRTREDMWGYLINEVTVRLIPEIDDLNNDLSRHFMIMGYARLRQVRSVKNESTTDCFNDIPPAVWPRDSAHKCIQAFYGNLPEENYTFNEDWKYGWPGGSSPKKLDDSAYRYYPAEELKSQPYFGEHGIYSGGGYVQTFVREDPGAVQLVLRQLSNSEWVDRFTRCIFLEFTVYNPPVDMYTQVTIAFEFDLFGGVFATKSLNTANISLKDERSSSWFKLVQIIYCVCLTLSIMISVTRMLREGVRDFFSNLWNWAEMLMIFVTLLCILFYVMLHHSFLSVMEDFRQSGHSFYLDFTTVFFWRVLFQITAGLAGSIAILKMIKVTAFNPFWKTFSKTVTLGLSDFQAFIFATMFIVLAYCGFALLTFGSQAKVYSTFGRSMFTLLFFILGEPDFETVVGVDLFFGRIFFLTFMFISQYFIVFMFIAILRDALDIARYMDYEHEQAVIKYIVDTVLLYLNAFSPQMRTSTKRKELL